MTLEMAAQGMAKYSELQAQYGDAEAAGHFEQFLNQSLGMNSHTFWTAYNVWYERFEADPTGQLQAKFSMLMQQGATQAHFGDVRDMSQDVLEGITLEQYAAISARIAGGEPFEQVVAEFGLDHAGYQRAQNAWNAAMAADTTFKLTTQYGELYAKYTPNFQQNMQNQVAAMLVADKATRDVDDDDEDSEDLTPEQCLADLDSKSREARWLAARHLANMYQIADFDETPQARGYLRCVPVLVEILERHDDETVSDAENAAELLMELERYTDEVRYAMELCLNRAQEKLGKLEAAFAPIQNQRVPERVFLQAKIQDFTSLVNTLAEHLSEEWEQPERPVPRVVARGGVPVSAAERAAENVGASAAALGQSVANEAASMVGASVKRGLVGKIKSLFR
ncbi:MAG: hypothetical protein ACE366_07665 [Bradymonadia bacterium]